MRRFLVKYSDGSSGVEAGPLSDIVNDGAFTDDIVSIVETDLMIGATFFTGPSEVTPPSDGIVLRPDERFAVYDSNYGETDFFDTLEKVSEDVIEKCKRGGYSPESYFDDYITVTIQRGEALQPEFKTNISFH